MHNATQDDGPILNCKSEQMAPLPRTLGGSPLPSVKCSVIWPLLASRISFGTRLTFLLLLKQVTFFSDSRPSHVWCFLPGTHSSPPARGCTFSSIISVEGSLQRGPESLWLVIFPSQPLGGSITQRSTTNLLYDLFLSFMICKTGIVKVTGHGALCESNI